MPAELVDSVFDASPYAVVAAVTGMLPRFGWTLVGVGDFGRSVTWQAFDKSLEMVQLHAEVSPVAGHPRQTRLRVSRVDEALASAERFATPPLPAVRRSAAGPAAGPLAG